MSDVMVTDRFAFFWGGWPSQWHRCRFSIDGVTYNCCEQFMMAEKARVFGDADVERAILAATNPRQQKALGRTVRHFDVATWNSVCRGIVYLGNLAKFEQNDDLRELLLATEGRTIVEASPKDSIWGIGLAQDDPRAQDPRTWRGKNWLGVALLQVRDELDRRSGKGAAEMDAMLTKQLAAREAITTNRRG